MGVPITEVRQTGLREVGVSGTPTLLLVNEKGSITKSWIGQLRADKEAEVLGALRGVGR